jgi:hypothetical protein
MKSIVLSVNPRRRAKKKKGNCFEMTTIQVRKMVGLENHQPWPRKLSFALGMTNYTLADLEQCENYLRSLGYTSTAINRRPDGVTIFVFLRDIDTEDPETLLIECRDALKESLKLSDIERTTLIKRINTILGDES